MKLVSIPFIFISLFLIIGCSNDPDTPENELPKPLDMYFPPLNGNEWETISITQLDWNEAAEQSLYEFLEENNTDAFIILKDGRMVIEKYFGDFDATKNHSWNSAAKTLTSITVGIAQQEGFLDINNPSSDYMGVGWSSLTPEEEQNITVKHHLTMTTGLDYTVENNFCTDKECLIYKEAPNTFWYYHNATYSLLDDIVAEATNQDFNTYFSSKIRDRIGMQGSWIKTGFLNLYFSTARSMARFGLLNLNEGQWEDTIIWEDQAYFNQATTTSQVLNPSYGYLYWLNGKNGFRLPESEELYPGKLIPSAPDDLYAGLGAFDQKLYVVPSQGLVVVRMGDAANSEEFGPTSFDNELWDKIDDLIN